MYKRKQYLINKSFQLRLLFYLGSISLASIATIAALVIMHIKKVEHILMSGNFPPTAPTINIHLINTAFLWEIVAVVVATLTIYFVIGVRITHRIAGPIYKLKRELNKYIDGTPIDPITFRKDDEFKDVALLINQVLEKKKNN